MIRHLIIIALLLLTTLSGCGVKGDLVPKGKPLPAAPGVATVQQQGNDILLSWAIPTANQDGSPLVDLQQFIIYRLPYVPGDYCSECRDPDTDHVRIHLDRPEPAIRVGDRLYLRDTDLPLDEGYRYRIIPLNSFDDRGAEAVAHRVLIEPPQPPISPNIIPHDRSLRLQWEIEKDQNEKIEQLGVNIYRTTDDKPFSPRPINSQPITGQKHDDFNLDNQQLYRYALRSVIKINSQIIESAFSETITATPAPEF